MLLEKQKSTIHLLQREYDRAILPWSVGYSGGKDSSAMMKLLYQAIEDFPNPKKHIKIVYCDTGVEIPIITKFVKNIFLDLDKKSRDKKLPFSFHIAEPKITDRFFVKVIGRGYPPPTNIFRWCTDRLRIKPIQELYKKKQSNIVLVGVRNNESYERNKIINRNSISAYYLRQNKYNNIRLFAPIINYHPEDIWNVLNCNNSLFSINFIKLAQIYRSASTNKTFESISNVRFGCWICTVIRKDHSMNNLIKNGNKNLIPLLEYRNFIYNVRDKKEYRCKYRRNGCIGPGPLTLEARKLFLAKLIEAQDKSNYNLINDLEINAIYELWEKDMKSLHYREN